MPLLTTDRGRFFCQEAGPGPGPALFLCHGLTSNHRAWERVEGPLAGAGFHLFAFDMRGHGASDRPGSGYAPEDHARDLEACVRALGLGRVQAVGHSTGGRNALVFAALFPALVAGLAVIDQTLSADAESWRKYQKRYGEYPVPFADEGALDAFLREKFPDDARRFDYYKSQFWARPDGRWDFNFSIQAAWETQRLGRARDAFAWLPRVECPALFVKGADSRYVPIEEARAIVRALPRGRLAVVERAEHAVQRDNPQGLLEVLVPFLKGNLEG